MSYGFLIAMAVAAVLVTPIFVLAALRESRARAGIVAAPKPRVAKAHGPKNPDRWGVGPDARTWAPIVKQAVAWSRARSR